jgi:hypothetical protein
MPYSIEPKDGGYVVMGPSGPKSAKPLTKIMAERQLTALNIAHARAPMPPMPTRKIPPTMCMPMDEYHNEHVRLIKTLESGSPKAQKAEAAAQKAEMKRVMGH